ncbi:hypothetical protein GRX01_06415 [Halobaculum sp. WSA2]|uniref:DUF7344 domain-containing protein n=1 Tax=Halobaculum saliterrae TaxID=2073113 RepID=A0A6B0SPY6_9EURY|nr:hypothetical protein [Halobaculum saliterrae]MXR40974.1 hypothetical protein [Halobaculum saliterrae]
MSIEETDHVDESETAEDDLSEDTLYSVLSNRRRRYTIHYLKQREEPVSVQDLAERVAAWENDKRPSEITSQERKRVYVSLYQSHLDTLDGEGIVEYDSDAGTVRLSDRMRAVDIYLEVVPKESVPWSLYYAGLSAANALVLALAWLEVRPFDAVPDLAWGAVVLASFALSAFAQLYSSRQMRLGDEGPPPDVNLSESGA